MRRLALLLAAAALTWLIWNWQCRSRDPAPIAPASDDVQACVENLRAIYAGLLAYEEEHGGPPPRGGVALLAELVWSGTWPDDAESARRLSCPGALVGEHQAGAAPGEWLADRQAVGPHSSAYTARDLERFPLARLTGGGREPEALVACDNALGANHPGGVTCVLKANGSVVRYVPEQEVAAGALPPGTTTLAVGPGSPIPALAVMVGEE